MTIVKPVNAAINHSRGIVVFTCWAAFCLPLVTAIPAQALVYGVDGRKLVTSFDSLSAAPWGAIGNIRTTFPDGARFTGTGTLVSPHHMLTAAHVVYDAEHGGYADEIWFYPQRNGRLVNTQLRAKNGVGLYVPYNYRLNSTVDEELRDFSSDYALVPLDRPIGNFTGWLNIQSYEDYVYPQNGRLALLQTAGYPGDLPNRSNQDDPVNATYMYADSGGVDQVTTDFLHFYPEDETWIDFWTGTRGCCRGMDWAAGQSGSPMIGSVYSVHGENHRVVGVLSNQQNGTNNAVKISRKVEGDLGLWMGLTSIPGRGIVSGAVTADAPPSMADLAGSEGSFQYLGQSGLSEDSLQITLDVNNYGTETSTSTAVQFVASHDETVSADDVVLGETLAASVAPFTSTTVSFSTQPTNLAPGRYYLGWSIDSYNLVQEYDDSDNTGVFSQSFVVVGGDYNHDGLIDYLDYFVWKQWFGSTVSLDADANRNGIVDAADYTIWRDSLGTIVSPANAHSAVSEPSSFLLIMLGMTFVAARAVRRIAPSLLANDYCVNAFQVELNQKDS